MFDLVVWEDVEGVGSHVEEDVEGVESHVKGVGSHVEEDVEDVGDWLSSSIFSFSLFMRVSYDFLPCSTLLGSFIAFFDVFSMFYFKG